MPNHERILRAIYEAIDEVNDEAAGRDPLDKAEETPLFGHASRLDSLGLVNLIVTVEERIGEDFGVNVSLADERAMSQRRSPFLTVRTLADYIAGLLEEGSGRNDPRT